jgi:Carboxypeptidase regulatory-like domain
MIPKVAKLVLVLEIFLLALALSPPALSQQAGATLSGIVTAPSGTAVPNAKVSLKNLATPQSTEIQTDASGRYQFPNLAPGD